jgi:hypothetical protein
MLLVPERLTPFAAVVGIWVVSLPMSSAHRQKCVEKSSASLSRAPDKQAKVTIAIISALSECVGLGQIGPSQPFMSDSLVIRFLA